MRAYGAPLVSRRDVAAATPAGWVSELRDQVRLQSLRRSFVGRAVQRSVLSPKCNTIQRSEAQREVEDSADGKSLNLCEATESFGGRLEVVRTSSFAVRDNSRPASGRG